MASRLPLPGIPSIDLERLRPDVRTTRKSLAAHWPTDREGWKQAIWRLVFFPYWFWSDLPKPAFPERNAALPAGGLAGDFVKSRLTAIARRTWLQRSLMILARTLTLTIMVVALWQAIEILGGPAVDFSTLPIIFGLFAIPALVLIAASRPSNAQIARMLDRSFHLQERVVTALANIGHEIPAAGERAGLRYLQVADAANALTAIRSNPAFRIMPPVRELVLGIIFALVFAALYFLRGGGGDVAQLQSVVVPEFIPAAQQYVAEPDTGLPGSPLSEEMLSQAQLQDISQQSSQIREDLLALAGALEDHALTRSAASAIAQGDYDRAVQDLRAVAEQVDGLSDTESESLASDLDQASSAMSEGGQGLSEAAQDAATGLREGGSEAQEGMQGVADAVEESAEQLASNEALSESAEQGQESQAGADGGVPEQAQSSGEQSSLFDNQSSARPGSEDSGGDQQESQNGEPSDQQAEGQAGSSDDGGAGDQQEGEQAGSEDDPGSGNPGSSAQYPSEDVTGGGGEAPPDDASMMERPPVAGTGQDSSAGGNDSEASTDESPAGSSSGTESEAQLPDPSEADVSESESSAERAAEDEESVRPGGTVMLNRAPEGQAVLVQGSGSQSNLGSGSGVASAGGGSTQGEVGKSGPDSNHVPPEYRSIVESYFSPGDE